MLNQTQTQSTANSASVGNTESKPHLSIEAYHKLNRSQAVSNYIGGDLMKRELNGLHQLYIPHILSYLNEDIGFVLEELKAKGLCTDFMHN
jgi:hypothetical protein